jgi:hypothetical protein
VTPTLIIGGDAQSEELYFALQAHKVDSALLAPGPADEPVSQVTELSGVLAWLDRWMKPAAEARP